MKQPSSTTTCPRCGKLMVQKPPDRLYLSNPPQWDCIMWCGCGYQENLGRVQGMTEEESLRDQWESLNSPHYPHN